MTRSVRRLVLALPVLLPAIALAAEPSVRVELNAAETAENRCRLTFVIQNKSDKAIDSLKLDLVAFNAEGIVYRRLITEMAPVRSKRTNVRAFLIEGDCAQLGAVLVNDVTACVPGEPAICIDSLELTSRIKGVKLYK